jgi:hypothetical protein
VWDIPLRQSSLLELQLTLKSPAFGKKLDSRAGRASCVRLSLGLRKEREATTQECAAAEEIAEEWADKELDAAEQCNNSSTSTPQLVGNSRGTMRKKDCGGSSWARAVVVDVPVQI